MRVRHVFVCFNILNPSFVRNALEPFKYDFVPYITQSKVVWTRLRRTGFMRMPKAPVWAPADINETKSRQGMWETRSPVARRIGAMVYSKRLSIKTSMVDGRILMACLIQSSRYLYVSGAHSSRKVSPLWCWTAFKYGSTL